MKFSLGISPCPNDTFIFDQVIHNPGEPIDWELHMEDVETLNRWALQGKLDITKLSFATYLQVQDLYELMDTGSALGYGVGPLLVSNKAYNFDSFEALSSFVVQSRIAIPGRYTTANLLLSLAFPDARQKEETVFSDIEPRVLSNEFDLGLLIHEGRFTYTQKGLHKIMDLGEWWEENYKAPIPLGGICIRKSLGPDMKLRMEKMIADSLRHSWNQYPALSSFVTDNAQEMDEEVMRSHIELYVNDESLALSQSGKEAINLLREHFLLLK